MDLSFVDRGEVVITVSKCSSYNGDAVTGRLTHCTNCSCISANTVCHTLTFCTGHTNIVSSGKISRTHLGRLLPSISI